jgi:hypothetical protein
MGAIVTFDHAAWVARYPEFATLPESAVQSYFAEATLYWRNDGGSPAGDPATQEMLLGMLTAHLAALYGGVNGGAPSDMVGRINSATIGPATVSADMGAQPGTAAWFQQTKYGASFWQATAAYRRMPLHFPGPCSYH